MSKSTQLIIKVVCVCAVFLPYKFVIMAGEKTSFLQDFMAALAGYLLAYAVIYFVQRGNSANGE